MTNTLCKSPNFSVSFALPLESNGESKGKAPLSVVVLLSHRLGLALEEDICRVRALQKQNARA